jgi:hypothetical protein
MWCQVFPFVFDPIGHAYLRLYLVIHSILTLTTGFLAGAMENLVTAGVPSVRCSSKK